MHAHVYTSKFSIKTPTSWLKLQLVSLAFPIHDPSIQIIKQNSSILHLFTLTVLPHTRKCVWTLPRKLGGTFDILKMHPHAYLRNRTWLHQNQGEILSIKTIKEKRTTTSKSTCRLIIKEFFYRYMVFLFSSYLLH